MTAYRINPAIGAGIPTGFTQRYGSGKTYSVTADTGSPNGTKLSIVGSSSGRTLLSYDAVNADVDRGTAKLLYLVRQNSNNTVLTLLSGMVARGSYPSSTETAAIGGFANRASGSTPDIIAQSYNAGVSTNTMSGANCWAVGTLYWMTVDIAASTTTVNLYALSDRALTTPLATTAHAAPASNANNWIGYFSFYSGVDTDFLYSAIGTGATAFADLLPIPAVLSGEGRTVTGSTTATGVVTTDKTTGILYAVVTTSATPPSEAAIVAGTGATYATSVTVSSAGEKTFNATGLAASANYHWHFLHYAAATGASNIATTTLFTTDAAPGGFALVNDIALRDGSNALVNDTGVTVVVQTKASPPVVINEYLADIVAGYISIVDTPFETLTNTRTMVLRKGEFYSRVIDATVVAT